MCYVEPAPIYGYRYLFIHVIPVHFDQYCCVCLLSFLAEVRTEKGIYILTELITGGQLYEQMRDQCTVGIMEGITRTCIVCEFMYIA